MPKPKAAPTPTRTPINAKDTLEGTLGPLMACRWTGCLMVERLSKCPKNADDDPVCKKCGRLVHPHVMRTDVEAAVPVGP